MVPQWPKVCPAPLTPSAAQGLKTLTFSSSHPALALEAEQAKHEGEEDWFSVFQLPDSLPGVPYLFSISSHKALSHLVCCPVGS